MKDSAKKPKRPRDTNQLAKLIADIATGETQDVSPDEGKDPAAVALGRKGGKARAKVVSPQRRSEIARKAAKSRWKASADAEE